MSKITVVIEGATEGVNLGMLLAGGRVASAAEGDQIAEVDRLTAENEKFDEGMRAIACRLSAGGYNAETLTADQLVEKVTWGVSTQAMTAGKMIDDLRAELQRQHESHRTTWTQLEQANREIEAMKVDAGRYRWLIAESKEKPAEGPNVVMWEGDEGYVVTGANAAGEIDAAMQEAPLA